MSCRLCCIKLSLAVRVIAMVGLITSMLVLTQLASQLIWQGGKDPDEAGAVSILLGLDIEEAEDDPFINNNKITIMWAFLGFAFIYAISSALLVWGSIVESRIFALPWLVCEAVSFATQIFTLTKHGFKHATTNDKWIILLSIANMCLSIYFWLVVFLGQLSWARMEKERKENETVSTTSSLGSRPPTDVPDRV